jgi:hypothetical protein
VASFAPEDGPEDLDLEVPDFPHGKTWDFLKRDRVVAEDFLWSGGLKAIFARAALGIGLGVQRPVKIGILSDAPDERRMLRKGFEQDFVGVAAVDGNQELAQFGVWPLVESVSEAADSKESDLGKGESFLAFLVLIPCLRRGVLFGFSDGRSWFEADWQ